jgi:hypothetical protein
VRSWLKVARGGFGRRRFRNLRLIIQILELLKEIVQFIRRGAGRFRLRGHWVSANRHLALILKIL